MSGDSQKIAKWLRPCESNADLHTFGEFMFRDNYRTNRGHLGDIPATIETHLREAWLTGSTPIVVYMSCPRGQRGWR